MECGVLGSYMSTAGLPCRTDSGQCGCVHQDWLYRSDRKSQVLAVSTSIVRRGCGTPCFHVATMVFLGFKAGFRVHLTGTGQEIYAGCRILAPC